MGVHCNAPSAPTQRQPSFTAVPVAETMSMLPFSTPIVS